MGQDPGISWRLRRVRIPGRSADREPPRVAMFPTQVGSEDTRVGRDGCGNPFEGRTVWRTEIPDVPTGPEVHGWRSPGSRVVDASGRGSRAEPTPLPPQRPQGSVGRNQGHEAERKRGFDAEPPLSRLSNGKTLKLRTLPPINKKKPFKMV